MIISCMLYLYCHLATRTHTKKEQVNILQWRSISLLKSLFLYMRSKQELLWGILQWVPELPSSFLYSLVSSTLTFCSFRLCETRVVDGRPVVHGAIEVWPSVGKYVAYWGSRSRRSQIKSYERLVECCSDFWFHIWHVSKTDAPMAPFMFDELSAVFKKLVGLIFKKDNATDNARSIARMLTMHDQLLACWQCTINC